MEYMIFSGVETSVMEMKTPVNVAVKPGQEKTGIPGTGIKDAVPPVQTAASKTKMVKLFLKQDTQKSHFLFS